MLALPGSTGLPGRVPGIRYRLHLYLGGRARPRARGLRCDPCECRFGRVRGAACAATGRVRGYRLHLYLGGRARPRARAAPGVIPAECLLVYRTF